LPRARRRPHGPARASRSSHRGAFRILPATGFVCHALPLLLDGVPHPRGALTVGRVRLGSYDPASFTVLPVMGEQLRFDTTACVIPVETLDTGIHGFIFIK